MRGKRARQLRREALPPDLRAEMKKRIAVVAAERAAAIGAARKAREAAIRKAQDECGKAFGAAWLIFEEKRAVIVAEFESRARERGSVRDAA